MLKSVFAPSLNRTVKFGRRMPPANYPALKLASFIRKSLPSPPGSVDYSAKALPSLRDVDGNDKLGDCVIAMGFHARGVTSGNAGACKTFTPAEIVHDYGAIGGYVPGDPSTDNGCDEPTALDYWTRTGFPDGVKLAGWLSVNAANPTEIATALWLFENVLFGTALPDAWINPFPSADGFVWDSAGAANPSNGHAYLGYGYNGSGVLIDTWALFGLTTYNAAARYNVASAGGELHVLLSPDIISAAVPKAPAGFDWSGLVQAFDDMGGNIPLPSPAPTPVPPAPVPVPVGPTFQQKVDAIFAALEQKFAHNRYVLGVLIGVQRIVDQYIQANNLQAHLTIPPGVIAVIDAAFASAEAQYPGWAVPLAVANKLVDAWLMKM